MPGTPQQPGGQLAPGWTEHTAPDGRKYFFNKASNKSVWDRHLAEAPAATPPPKVCLPILWQPPAFSRKPSHALHSIGHKMFVRTCKRNNLSQRKHGVE